MWWSNGRWDDLVCKKNSVNFVIKITDNTNTFESIFIELSCKYKLIFLIGAIYRHPNTELSSFDIEFENVLKPLLSRGVKCIMAGDYNSNLWHHLSNNETGNFVNNLFDMSVLPMIMRPTRYGETVLLLLIISYLINCMV